MQKPPLKEKTQCLLQDIGLSPPFFLATLDTAVHRRAAFAT
jgi:hypothetical protein